MNLLNFKSMKQLKKLKLNNMAQGILNDQEMSILKGGDFNTCMCGCGYANSGGASNSENKAENDAHDYGQSYGTPYIANGTATGAPCNPAGDNPCWSNVVNCLLP